MTAPDSAAPVFVFGALRSGTTLFRLMLNMHQDLSNPGEFDFLFDHLSRRSDGGWRYDFDALAIDRVFVNHKLSIDQRLDGEAALADFVEQLQRRAPGAVLTLNIHRHAAMAAKLFPAARVLHILRDPRDVARSSIAMGWSGNLYYGVDHWIATERGWDASREAWGEDRICELRYEDLVADAPGALSRVCRFLGVPYSARMLDFHEGSTYGPVDPKLAWQWRRKCEPGELALCEGKMADLMTARGYEPSSDHHRAPGAAERVALFLANKTYIYRHLFRRDGVALTLVDKLSRRLGLSAAHRWARRRINENVRRSIR